MQRMGKALTDEVFMKSSILQPNTQSYYQLTGL